MKEEQITATASAAAEFFENEVDQERR